MIQATISVTHPASPVGARLDSGRRTCRLGFVGVGWIGLHRLKSAAALEEVEIAAVFDSSAEAVERALEVAPQARPASSLDDLLDDALDGVVIATPSAQHAEQAQRALARRRHVFCQKPLARTAAECQAIVEAARRADRLLGVDFAYRHIAGMSLLRGLAQSGELGPIVHVDLTFHNAYGPDKDWFYSRELSGGGCLIDLGVHLVDLAQWVLEDETAVNVSSRLFRNGRALSAGSEEVEDLAVCSWETAGGTAVRLACSWRLPAGRDADISAAFYGTQGGVRLRNVNGSFYDFVTERYSGTRTTVLSEPPDDWGGRAIQEWARQIAAGSGFDAKADSYVATAQVLDRLYGRCES